MRHLPHVHPDLELAVMSLVGAIIAIGGGIILGMLLAVWVLPWGLP